MCVTSHSLIFILPNFAQEVYYFDVEVALIFKLHSLLSVATLSYSTSPGISVLC